MTAVEAAASMTGRRAMWAGVIAGAALCYAVTLFASALELGFGGYAPMVFGVPAGVGFFVARRLRWGGALFIAIAIAAAYYAAYFLAVQTYSHFSANLCLFCSGQQYADDLPYRLQAYALAGLVGGLAGSLLSFIAFALIARDLRDKRARRVALVGIVLLTLLGAVATTIAMEWGSKIPALGNFVLFAPWQLVFGWRLIKLLGPRQAR